MHHIAHNLKYLREKKNLTQAEMADLFEVNRDNIASYERGTEPKIELLQKVANYFHIEIGNLINADFKNGDLEKIQVVEDQMQVYSRRGKKHDQQSVPLYDIEASAGIVELFDKTQNVLGEISIPNLPKCDGAIKITGDSMYPVLKAGDIVLYSQVTEIPDGIFWGEMYLVQVNVGGGLYMTTCKYVQKSELGDDYIRLVSQNQHHHPKDVKVANVRGVAFVKASIRINSNT
jgi:transcriptional regulator with XRE-family HTH domain